RLIEEQVLEDLGRDANGPVRRLEGAHRLEHDRLVFVELGGIDAANAGLERAGDEPSRGIAAHAIGAEGEIDGREGRRDRSVGRMWDLIHDVFSECSARNSETKKARSGSSGRP